MPRATAAPLWSRLWNPLAVWATPPLPKGGRAASCCPKAFISTSGYSYKLQWPLAPTTCPVFSVSAPNCCIATRQKRRQEKGHQQATTKPPSLRDFSHWRKPSATSFPHPSSHHHKRTHTHARLEPANPSCIALLPVRTQAPGQWSPRVSGCLELPAAIGQRRAQQDAVQAGKQANKKASRAKGAGGRSRGTCTASARLHRPNTLVVIVSALYIVALRCRLSTGRSLTAPFFPPWPSIHIHPSPTTAPLERSRPRLSRSRRPLLPSSCLFSFDPSAPIGSRTLDPTTRIKYIKSRNELQPRQEASTHSKRNTPPRQSK